MGTRVAAWFETGPFDRRQLAGTPAGRRLVAVLDGYGFTDVSEAPDSAHGVVTFSAWDYEANYGTEAFKEDDLAVFAREAGLWWAMGTAGGPTWSPSLTVGSPDGRLRHWEVDLQRHPLVDGDEMDRCLRAARGDEARAWRAVRVDLARGARSLADWIAHARPASSAMCPTPRSEGPGPSPARRQDKPSPPEYFATAERRTVTVPGKEEHLGLDAVEVSLRWACPVCGGPRGEIRQGVSTDDGCALEVSVWANPCGHDDLYAAVRAEARVDELIGGAVVDEQAKRVRGILAELAEQIDEASGTDEGGLRELSFAAAYESFLIRHLGTEGLGRWAAEHGVRVRVDPLLGDDNGITWVGTTRGKIRPLSLSAQQGEVYFGLVRAGMPHDDAVVAALAVS